MAALTFSPVDQLTDETFNPSSCDFVYGPDRSVYVVYDIGDSAAAEKRGIFLRKRKRDKTWLAPYRVDYIATDSEFVDFNATIAYVPDLIGGTRCLAINSSGDIYVGWRQAGRAASAIKSICFRKLTYNGNDDSYGNPSDVAYYNDGAGNVGQDLCMVYNQFELALWIAFSKTNVAKTIYWLEGDSMGLISSAREQTVKLDPADGTAVTADSKGAFLDVDSLGNTHLMVITLGAGAQIQYGYRTLGTGFRNATSPTLDMWADTRIIHTNTASDPINECSMRAKTFLNVAGYFTKNLTTNKQVWAIEKTAAAWTETHLDNGASTDAISSSGDGPDALGSNLVMWYEKASTEGLWYSIETNYAWSTAVLGIPTTTTGTVQVNHLHVHFRKYPRTPYQLGIANPLYGQVGVAWLQRN